MSWSKPFSGQRAAANDVDLGAKRVEDAGELHGDVACRRR